jgi:deoxyribonuclease-4
MKAKFGPSGNSAIFYEQGYKSSTQAPKWLCEMGLDAYEYQCNKGVKISKERAEELGKEAEKYNIQLSIHSPYYINLSSVEEEKRTNSVNYIIETLKAAKNMGAKRIVVHSGSCAKIDRGYALGLAKGTLKTALEQAKALGLGDIHICPETMGKLNQLGTLEEVMELCKLDDNMLPTIDFGHVHARGLGCLKTMPDFEKIFDTIENSLGRDRLSIFHSHYSRIEYTNAGEKKHWCYSNTEYGPEFEPIAELICKKNISPTIICESRDTMADDSVKLKAIYNKFLGE